MGQEMNRQQIFVSSTVNDFKDLRGAIKYWLEELGLVVYMSEFTDFPRNVNDDTYKSCFGVIPRCDYFVLLVGGRRGSWYCEGEVSVTQQEFRIAAELAKQGQINLIVLARDDVNRVLRALKDSGQPLGNNTIEIAGISIQDPAFTNRFLEEIKHTQLEEKGNDPSGQMWIYYFDDLRDIAEVLRSNLRLFGSVPRQTLLANLRWELVENISRISSKRDGRPSPGYWFVEDVRQDVKLTSGSDNSLIPLTIDQAAHIVWFLVVGMPGVGSLRTVALSDAIRSREFLNYNQASNRLEPSKPLEMMYQLLGQIEGFATSYKWWWDTQLNRVVNDLRMGISAGHPMVWEHDLLFIFGFYDRLVNIMRLTISLIEFIDDQSREVVVPELIEPSPYGEEESKRIGEETTTHQDVDIWLKFEMTRRNLTRQDSRVIEIPEWVATFHQFPTLWEDYARKHAVTTEEAQASMRMQKQLYDFRQVLESEGLDAARQFLKDSMHADERQKPTQE